MWKFCNRSGKESKRNTWMRHLTQPWEVWSETFPGKKKERESLRWDWRKNQYFISEGGLRIVSKPQVSVFHFNDTDPVDSDPSLKRGSESTFQIIQIFLTHPVQTHMTKWPNKYFFKREREQGLVDMEWRPHKKPFK